MSLCHCAHGWSSFLIIFRTKCRFAFYKNQPADKWVVIRVWGWSPSHMEVNLFRTNTEESINLSVKYLGLPGIIRKPSGTRFFYCPAVNPFRFGFWAKSATTTTTTTKTTSLKNKTKHMIVRHMINDSFEDTLKRTADKEKKKVKLYCYSCFYKASVKSALKDNWNNCKNCHPLHFARVKKSVLIQRY